ncbi:MAG: class II aldolase/adducin family protein [Planctomycetota bacterium]|nr:class II aldolase/adducin family protein [Planctomycetota bacterium]
MNDLLDQLVEMSRSLGDPAYDFAVLGEGNTSVLADQDSFWVKASGAPLVCADRESFVRVQSAPVLTSLDGPLLDDRDVQRLLRSATVASERAPSIETFLHALCLQLEGVQFVGHTHPTVAVGLLCSQRSREIFAGSLFPDQIVLLGPAYVYIPYTDPGLPLALTVRQALQDFQSREGRVPKVILMENHGVIALGATAQEVLNITHMLVKTCRVISTTLAAGGPRPLSPQHVARIDQRPDELARRHNLR